MLFAYWTNTSEWKIRLKIGKYTQSHRFYYQYIQINGIRHKHIQKMCWIFFIKPCRWNFSYLKKKFCFISHFISNPIGFRPFWKTNVFNETKNCLKFINCLNRGKTEFENYNYLLIYRYRSVFIRKSVSNLTIRKEMTRTNNKYYVIKNDVIFIQNCFSLFFSDSKFFLYIQWPSAHHQCIWTEFGCHIANCTPRKMV